MIINHEILLYRVRRRIRHHTLITARYKYAKIGAMLCRQYCRRRLLHFVDLSTMKTLVDTSPTTTLSKNIV